jgi:hypothetical protein
MLKIHQTVFRAALRNDGVLMSAVSQDNSLPDTSMFRNTCYRLRKGASAQASALLCSTLRRLSHSGSSCKGNVSNASMLNRLHITHPPPRIALTHSEIWGGGGVNNSGSTKCRCSTE